MSDVRKKLPFVEWQTLFLVGLCYGVWVLGTGPVSGLSPALGFVLTTLAITLHSSLQHEVLHGHPFRNRWLSEVLVFPAPGLAIPYLRFRETHLAHHQDSILTDPYDDPESNFLDPAVWAGLPRIVQRILTFNNTLFGRMLIGPPVSVFVFVRADLVLIRNGAHHILGAWLLHFSGVVLVVAWLAVFGQMSVWLYVLAAWAGLSILKIRTFLEHRAHDRASGRTVIIEDRGPLAFLFLNNNLHVVHHMHPLVPWYQLPGYYRRNKTTYLTRNDAYFYRSYAEIFARFFLKRKDPVPHPLWPQKPRDD